MSLTGAIHFRDLACQLTDKQLSTFIVRTMKNKQSMIISALFHHFSLGKNRADCDEFNTKLCKYIVSMKKREKKKEVIHSPILAVPRPVVGHISSYLNQLSNFNLWKTCRFAYLSCNTPNKLFELDLSFRTISTLPINLALFSNVHRISIKSSMLTSVPQTFLDQLQHVDLLHMHDFDAEDTGVFKNATCLSLGSSEGKRFGVDSYIQMFKKFPRLQYLEMSHSWKIPRKDMARFAAALIMVKGIKFYWGESKRCDELLSIIGSNLHFLSSAGSDLHINGLAKCVNLTEVEFDGPDAMGQLQRLLCKGRNLKAVVVSVNKSSDQNTLRLLLTTNKFLEHLQLYDVCAEPHQQAILESLEIIADSLVSEAIKSRKFRLKLRFAENWYCGENYRKMHRVLQKIINRLVSSKYVEQFMVVLDLRKRAGEEFSLIMPCYEGCCVSPVTQSIYMITSMGCSMCGCGLTFKL